MNDFEALVSDIEATLGAMKENEIDANVLARKLREYKSDRKDWEKYAFSDPDMQYTRNGVSKIDTKGDLLILVWTPGKSSAVHDHAKAHCLMRVLQGTLEERLYEDPHNGELKEKRVRDLHEGEVAYITDELGWHKISNGSPEVAVSLHLYTPPWASMYGCNIYDGGHLKHVDCSRLYSDNGVRLQN